MPVHTITAKDFVLGTLAALRTRLAHDRLTNNRIKLCNALSKAYAELEIYSVTGHVELLFDVHVEPDGTSPTINRAIDSLIKEGMLSLAPVNGTRLLRIRLNERQAKETIQSLPGDTALWEDLGKAFADEYGFILTVRPAA